ncbi:MAG: hypothetical protein K6G11_07490 [Lachnospiraceae bacterium]|nr:hypothetical protein [Lachnospiraceae bacterium]
MKKTNIIGFIVMLLVFTMLTGCGQTKNKTDLHKETDSEVQELSVMDAFSSYIGYQDGFAGELFRDKLNIKLKITPDIEDFAKGEFDIYSFTGSYSFYKDEPKNRGFVPFDFRSEENISLLKEYAPYIYENLDELTVGTDGLALNTGITQDEFETSNSLTWNIRYDLYKDLGKPDIKDLEDLSSVFNKIKKQSYPIALYDSGDDNLSYISSVNQFMSSYYGCVFVGDRILYNGESLNPYSTESPYVLILKWFNELYRNGILYPESKNINFEKYLELTMNKEFLFTLDSSLAAQYNEKNKDAQMLPVMPANAKPLNIIYPRSKSGTGVVFINSYDGDKSGEEKIKTSLRFLNYLVSPKGIMEMCNGPENYGWYLDKDNNPCIIDGNIDKLKNLCDDLGHGPLFSIGFFDWNSIKLSEFNNEYIRYQFWKNSQEYCFAYTNAEITYNISDNINEWREDNKAENIPYYLSKFETNNINWEDIEKPEVLYSKKDKKKLKKLSWEAIYAKSDKEFYQLINKAGKY